MEAVTSATSSGDGGSVATLRLNDLAVVPVGAREAVCDVGWVCRRCRLAFPSETGVAGHREAAGGGACKGGVLRLVQSCLACTRCDSSTERYDGALEFRRHCEQQHHQQSPGLSDEMEDVVNQITALAAKAAAQDTGQEAMANIFCPPPPSAKHKHLFATPNSVVAVPSTCQ